MTSKQSSEDDATEAFDAVVREYIDFVNMQVGVYMDALAGFAGHHARVERQVHRVSRRSHRSDSGEGETVVVWASYEDPTKPDVIHNRITRAVDYLDSNRPGGSNEEQHARAIVVFLYTAWESEFRPRLARARSVGLSDVTSDIMGDLRHLRHAIIHTRGVLRADAHAKLKELGGMFVADKVVDLPYEGMHTIFVRIKQDCARMMFEWLKVPNAAERARELRDVALQRVFRSRPVA